MAAAKNTNSTPVEDMKKTGDTIKDPMTDMVTVFLPKAPEGDENSVYVGLNGKAYRIMRGRSVRVPRPVADVLARSRRAAAKQDEYIEAVAQ